MIAVYNQPFTKAGDLLCHGIRNQGYEFASTIGTDAAKCFRHKHALAMEFLVWLLGPSLSRAKDNTT